MKHYLSLLGLLIILTACSSNDSTTESTLLISAATSLTDVLEEIVDLYEEEHTEINITLNIGGSGTLTHQIQQGAPADIFLSADEEMMNTLINSNLILPDTKIEFAKNRLVLITHTNSNLKIQSLQDLVEADIDQIAIGNPQSVPAGIYSAETLQTLGLWGQSTLQEQLVYAKDVRQVLTYVATGNTEVGFVYETDLLQEDSVQPLLTIDENLHNTITYPGAVTTSSKHPKIAKDFLMFLEQDEVKDIFIRHGFILADREV